MKILQEFREFALRGSVLDLAVGVIVGSAFGKIVSSLVSDIIMPPIGFLAGQVNFTELKYVLYDPGNSAPAVTVNYGAFIQNIADFLIVAAAVFLMVKGINKLKRKRSAEIYSDLNKEEKLLAEIRDLLKSKK